MNSLRRDLFERRLWPLAVVLIAAIVAVPFLLAGGHKSKATLAAQAAPVPAGATTTSSSTSTTSQSTGHTSTRSHAVAASTSRDPFAGGATTSAATTPSSSTPTGDSSSSSASSGSTDGSSGTTTVSSQTTTTVSPTTGGTGDGGTASTSTAATTTTTTTTSTKGSGATAQPRHTSPGTWTVYSVNVRVKSPAGATSALVDLPRFTPLPAATWPKIMYVGTSDGGHDAVFALGTGVSASGPARCRPSHDHCSFIALRPGGTEHVNWTIGLSIRRTMKLTVTRISSQVFHRRETAQAAIDRHSAYGLCEVELGDPLSYRYDSSTGQLVGARSSEPDCTKAMKKHLLPFPGPSSGASGNALSGAGLELGQ